MVDIEYESPLEMELPPQTSKQFPLSGTDDDTTKKTKYSGDDCVEPDLLDNFFLSSNQPIVVLTAISICFVAAMELLPQPRHDPDIWKDKLESVSRFYGPGVAISWCISGISILYDANQDFRKGGFYYLKSLALVLVGVIAAVDAVKRALQEDFGPSYAAALYMSDKSFELATLLYTVYWFPVRRRGSARLAMYKDIHTAEQPGNSSVIPMSELDSYEAIAHLMIANFVKTRLGARTAATIKRYIVYPCVTMVSIWLWARALAKRHPVYNIHAQNPIGVNIGWNPVLSSRYWKLAIPFVCFSLTSCLSVSTGWDLWSWGVPMGILSSFATLHSGLFGTFTPLKMTSHSILDLDQNTTLVVTIVVLILQYANEILVSHKIWEIIGVKMFELLGRLHRKAASSIVVTISAITRAVAISSNSFAELFRSLRLVASRAIRPRLHEDYSRIEWECTCGDLLYGDYLERKAGSLQFLAAQLGGRIISGPAIHQAPVNSLASPPQVPTQAHSQAASGTSSSSGSVGGPSNPTKPLQDGPSPTSTSGQTNSVTIQHSTSLKWLEICIRASADISILAEIDVAGAPTDKTVFDAIRHQYQLKKPSARLFGRFAYRVANGGCSVMFRKDKLVSNGIPPTVSVMKQNCMPSKGEANQYHYGFDPMPMDEPPIDNRTFRHYLKHPHLADPSRVWIERFPQLNGASLYWNSEKLAKGWGMEIIEERNLWVIVGCNFVSLLLSGTVATIYALYSKDNATGVAIGAWLTAVQAIVVSALLWHWTS